MLSAQWRRRRESVKLLCRKKIDLLILLAAETVMTSTDQKSPPQHLPITSTRRKKLWYDQSVLSVTLISTVRQVFIRFSIMILQEILQKLHLDLGHYMDIA